ncbi:hypothetical protein MTO96_035024 [Rhipicephalus appendiculatus]
MDVHTEGEGSYPATYKPSDWTPIIRAYKGGQPNPQTQVAPSQSVPVSAKPTASAVGAPADAAPASFKPSYRAQKQHLSVAHAVALRGKQLPLLPPGTIRVVFRPRGGLGLNGAMAQPLMRALQGTAAGRDLGELHLRIHPTNNTSTVATYHETTALHLVQLKELVLQTTTYPVAAYIAPPPAAVRVVISQACWEETPEQMLQDLQTRNPDADIISARRMGRTLFILITFAHGPVPHTVRYMSAVYRCTQYKGSPDACTNCRRPGHRYDVCPPPQKWPLLTVRRQARMARCSLLYPKLHSLWGPAPHGHRFVQGEKSHRQTTQPTASEDKVAKQGGLPLLGKTHPSTSAWSSGATRANGTTSQDSEVKALRGEQPPLPQSHHPNPSFASPPYNMAPPTGNSLQIIQWNCRGFRRKRDPLQQIIT